MTVTGTNPGLFTVTFRGTAALNPPLMTLASNNLTGGFARVGNRPGFLPVWWGGGGWFPFYGYPDYGYYGPTIVQAQFQTPVPVETPPLEPPAERAWS